MYILKKKKNNTTMIIILDQEDKNYQSMIRNKTTSTRMTGFVYVAEDFS